MLESEKYGIELIAETSQFKRSVEEISKMLKSLSKQVQKINHIPVKFGTFNTNNAKATSSEVYEETKRYTDLTRKIDKAQETLSKYDSKINQVKKDMEELATESEKTFELSAQLKELDFKADSGDVFTPAEGLLYSQIDREKLEKDEQKYFDATKKNEERLIELTQRRIIAEQQLQALKDKREKEASSGTTEEEAKKLREEVDRLRNSYTKVQNISRNTDSNLGNLFNKSIAKIKRFTFYLLGARSVFSLFMRYRSLYYQYNEEMQYQSELSQNAIALSLAPAFELLGNVITYASIGFAKFIELLTGVNVLSKVTTKGIRDYNKSLKETQTLISGIDEITNLTNPQNLGLASQYKALDNFQKKIAEVEKFFKENEIINTIVDFINKKLIPAINDVWEFIKKNIVPILKLEVFPVVEDIWRLGFKIIDVVGEIITKLGLVEKVIKPLWTIFKVVLHTAEFIVDVIDDLLHLNFKKVAQDFEKYKQKIIDDFSGTKKIKIEVDKTKYDDTYDKLKTLGEFGNVEIELEFENEQELENFKKYLNERKNDADSLNNALDFTTTINEDGKAILLFRDKAIQTIEDIKKSAEKYTAGGGGTSLGGGGTGAVGGSGSISANDDRTIKDTIESATKEGVEYAKEKAIDRLIDNFLPGGSIIKSAILNIFGNKLATGLDYVPYDNYPALLHKGEAVVPAKYNPTIHNQGSEYTNNLLETLVMKMDDLASRPNEFNIDGERLARTTYPLLRNEARNYNYNGGVSR